MKTLPFVTKTLLLMALATGQAHAYLDPGTGSMLLQGLIAGIMVVATTMGIYWHKFLDIVYRITGKDFRKTSRQDEDIEDEAPENES